MWSLIVSSLSMWVLFTYECEQLSVCVSSAIAWSPVHGVPHLSTQNNLSPPVTLNQIRGRQQMELDGCIFNLTFGADLTFWKSFCVRLFPD